MRRFWLLALLCVLLVVGSADARQVISLAGCTPASSDANVQYFHRMENDDTSTTNHTGCGGSGTGEDCTPGDDDLYEEQAAVNSTRVKMGSNSLTYYVDGACTTDYGYASYDSADAWDGQEDMRVGFWYYMDCIDTGSTIVHFDDNSASDDRMILRHHWDAGGPHADFELDWDDGTNAATCNGGSIASYLDQWLWMEIEVDLANDQAILTVYDSSLTEIGALGCSVAGSKAAFSSAVDAIYFLNSNASYQTESTIDHFVISTDPEADLRVYADDPAYDECT
jgi:hypothetical protein